MLSIERISPDHPLYPQACSLREEVLLQPLGLSMAWWRANFGTIEDRAEHFVAAVALTDRAGPGGRGVAGAKQGGGAGRRVIGCASLLPHDPGPRTGRLLQMAVDKQRQGEGVGRRLVATIESRAFGELGLQDLYCHAQVRASDFYERLGWEPVGEIFEEGGIPHRKMIIRCPAVEEDLF